MIPPYQKQPVERFTRRSSMIEHIILRLLGLVLLAMTAIKQFVEYRKYDNGARETRKKLFGSTLAALLFVFSVTAFQLKTIGWLDWFDEPTMYWGVTVGITIFAFTWFVMYFIKD